MFDVQGIASLITTVEKPLYCESCKMKIYWAIKVQLMIENKLIKQKEPLKKQH